MPGHGCWLDCHAGSAAAVPTMDPNAHGTTRQLDLQPIDIDSIVGSVTHGADFDRQFRPGRSVNTQRWERLSRAMLRGERIPPITIYRVGGRHYVQDGHHRISVARALGHRAGEAQISPWGHARKESSQPDALGVVTAHAEAVCAVKAAMIPDAAARSAADSVRRSTTMPTSSSRDSSRLSPFGRCAKGHSLIGTAAP